jgi:hypothetical protein
VTPPSAVIDRIVLRYLRETETRGSCDVYQEVADLAPDLPPAAVVRLVDRSVRRILAADVRAGRAVTVPNAVRR